MAVPVPPLVPRALRLSQRPLPSFIPICSHCKVEEGGVLLDAGQDGEMHTIRPLRV